MDLGISPPGKPVTGVVPEIAPKVSAQVVCQDIASLMKFYKSHMADFAEEHGMTSIQLYALYALNQSGMTMGKLAQTLHCDASNATGIVDRLVALQLLTRQENPADRRVKLLQLTSAGKRVLSAVNDELPGRLNCDRLTAAERASLHRLLVKLHVT